MTDNRWQVQDNKDIILRKFTYHFVSSFYGKGSLAASKIITNKNLKMKISYIYEVKQILPILPKLYKNISLTFKCYIFFFF